MNDFANKQDGKQPIVSDEVIDALTVESLRNPRVDQPVEEFENSNPLTKADLTALNSIDLRDIAAKPNK